MTANFLLIPALTVLAFALWASAMWYLQVWTPPEIRAWQRIAVIRGYTQEVNPVSQLVLRLPSIRRFLEESGMRKMLIVANRGDEQPAQFWTKAAGRALAVMVVFFGLDFLSLATSGDWAFPPFLPLVLGALVLTASFSGLRRQADRAREEVNRTLGDSLMLVTTLSGERGTPVDRAVELLSTCAIKDNLARVVTNNAWKQLVVGEPKSTIERYEMIGKAYDMEVFGQVAEALKNADVGMTNEDVLTRLATIIYAGRLQEAKMWAARAKILIVIPVALMLIPLLIMLGAPIFAAITGTL